MILIILLLSFILRLININQSFWIDEGSQILLSQMSLNDIFTQREGDFHPPLSYIFFHYWLMLGSGEVWIRLLSILFGVGAVYGVYKIGKYLINEKFALLAAFFLAIAPYHIYYSQEVRVYSISAFFAVWSTYFLLINSRSFYILSTAALLLTNYLGFFVLFSQIIYLLIHKREQIKTFVVNLCFIALVWSVWIPSFLEQLRVGVNVDEYLPGWGGLLSLSLYKAIPLTFVKFSIGRIDFDNQLIYGGISFFVLTISGALIIIALKNIKNKELLLYWLFVPILLAWLISFKVPLLQPFRLLVMLPGFYLLLSLGVWFAGKWRNLAFVLVSIISLISLSFYYFDSKFWREDWRGAANFIRDNKKEESIAVFAWPEPFDPFKIYGKDINSSGLVTDFPAKKEEVNLNLSKLSNNKQIFVFGYLQDLSDPEKLIQKWLIENGYKETGVYDFRGVGFVYQYVRF